MLQLGGLVKAWVAVKETTICKSFCKAGILDSTLNVVSCDLDDEDPFLAVDERHGTSGDSLMMVVTTVNGEDDVPVCLDACSDTWEEEFFDNLGQEDQGKEQDKEVILSLEDIQLFLESRGRLQDAMQVGNFMDNLSAVQIAMMISTLQGFI